VTLTLTELLIVAAAGAGAGIVNAVAGAGTLITFPTLLLLGFPPVVANVSNTVGLVPGSVAAAAAYRSTLRGRGAQVRRLLVMTSIGGLSGGLLLVLLPGRAFETVIPWLLLIAAALAALQPRIAAAVAVRRAARVARGPAGTAASTAATVPAAGTAASLGVLLVGVYGGYFGAAQGVMLLVVLGITLGDPINELNGVKNILAGTANLVSALLFIAVAEVDWAVAGAVAVGATVGGAVGGRYGRRLRPSALRVLLVAISVLAAVVRLVG